MSDNVNREVWTYAYRLYQKYAEKLTSSIEDHADIFCELCYEMESRMSDPEARALLMGVYSMLEATAKKTSRH